MLSYLVALLLLSPSWTRPAEAMGARHSYLFVWAGDSAQKRSDFLAVIDADVGSAAYGRVLTTVPTGTTGMPHHTEHELWTNGHMLANDFYRGRTWLFDLNDALHPKVLASFGDVAGYSHPHSFIRLEHGDLLTTFQYRAEPAMGSRTRATMAAMPMTSMTSMSLGGKHTTGGLVRMDERGNVLQASSASDKAITDRRLYPYSVLPIPAMNRAISTTTDMDLADSAATSQWVQIWHLSNLKLLGTIALPAGARGNENRYTGEARLLADGRSVYIHTFNCGLYLLRNSDSASPNAKLVHTFQGTDCGVPILAGHYWLQTVPAAHALVVLDIRDAEHPREVSRANFGVSEFPHWISMDPTGRRIVLNSAGHGSRLFILDFTPETGELRIDTHFRDAGSSQAGVSMSNRQWPGGFSETAIPHGSVFSR